MPLPTDPKAAWPPKTLRFALRTFDKWSAWYSGDPAELARVYGDGIGYGDENPNVGIDGSILNRSRERWFWGKRLGEAADLADARLHIPLAGDIAATSADLLFAEPPMLSVQGEDGGKEGDAPKPTTDRLNMLMGDGGFLPVLIEAAEIAASASGAFLRAGWVDDVADHVLIDAIGPESAVPEWSAGRLMAVTFWKVLAQEDNGKVWRHLERHEAEDGVGRILHALYVGTEDQIGELADLKSHPDTARFAEDDEAQRARDSEGDPSGLIRQIITGASRIAVEWVPNLRPPRKLKGTPYGRSDYDGIEPVMDAVDEVWSAWMRDIRIGKGRILVPEAYLHNHGRGQGAHFDAEQAVFQTIDALPSSEGIAMQVVQFAIRVNEHRDTITALVANALRGAGYSTQTFGEAGEAAATATEVVARERRSFTTRNRKILYWRAALARLLETCLQIDVAHFKPDNVEAVRPKIEFPDGVARDPMTVANTVALIHGAESASLYTRIKMVNPDWDDPQIREEMDRIRDDAKVMMAITAPPVPPPGVNDPAAPDPPTDGQGQADKAAPGSGGPGQAFGASPDDTTTGGPSQVSAERKPPTKAPTFAR